MKVEYLIAVVLLFLIASFTRGCQLEHDRAIAAMDIKREAIKAGWRPGDLPCVTVANYGSEFAQCLAKSKAP